ncbi:hypothetical protein AB0I98_41630 [Streptomyces sp. NPDC050211]|uniref:hypothetical protein n=1 Tax=Streptomyces sp. NPDC050211 TaxID=3154932 RepID=UPI003440DAD6
MPTESVVENHAEANTRNYRPVNKGAAFGIAPYHIRPAPTDGIKSRKIGLIPFSRTVGRVTETQVGAGNPAER